MHVLGIDVGGSGIKGAVVDTKSGELITERHRIDTPQPATPEAVVQTIAAVISHFNWKGIVGIGFPAAVQHGIVRTASNIDKSWIGRNLDGLVTEATGCPCYSLNDADAAGIAEFEFGAAHPDGTVFIITVGTGLGTCMFSNGTLVPNTELGHINLDGVGNAEKYASDATRKREDLKWSRWAARFSKYLNELEKLFWPDLFIIGGGASKKIEKFKGDLKIKTKLVAAQLKNEAGIVGAAIHAKNEDVA